MGVIPWGFESPLRHQVGRRGNGAHVKRGEGEDMNAVRVRPVSTPLGAARRESELPGAPPARYGKFRFLVSFCERGRAPLSHFPPSHAGSEPKVRCHCFSRLWRGSATDREEARGRRRHERGARTPRFHAARRCAPRIGTSSRAKRATASSDSWFSFCERGRAPLSHFPPGQAGSEPGVRCHCFWRAQPSAASRTRREGTGTPTSRQLL